MNIDDLIFLSYQERSVRTQKPKKCIKSSGEQIIDGLYLFKLNYSYKKYRPAN